VIESVAESDTAVPTHRHRNEEEHPHSWRNISSGESRLLVTIVPGGFEQLAYQVKDTAPEYIAALAGRFGCDILGPPGV
jgi:hypothetical protein